MIELSHVCKSYRVARRDAGFGNAVRALWQRKYDHVEALRDVSFTIGDGEIVGYIGPNGAGKSSTVKVMSGILTPDSGSCVIDGLVPWKERSRHVAHIGVVFGQRSQLWWDVPVVDSFELIREIYRVDEGRYRRTRDELCERLELGELLRTPARQLSLGQRMRCEIAASLLHGPSILFLDEPTIGLDAVSKLAVRRFIRELNEQQGVTVILTTHDMQDIEALAKRILLIGKGRILLDGTLEQLRTRYGRCRTIELQYTGLLSTGEGMTVLRDQEGRATLSVDTSVHSVSQAIAMLSREAEILDLSVTGASAEEMVASLYEEFGI